MGFLLSVFFGFVPMLLFAGFIYWLDHYEKEPKHLLQGAFIWGAVVAAGAAFLINTTIGLGIFALTGDESIAEFTTGSLVAPIVEELLKGMAVVIVYIFFRHEFDSVLDGIVYAAITALGFAATENTYYIYTYGFLENGYAGLFSLVFIRVLLVGWQHPFYTAFFGIGLAMARMNRSFSKKVIYPILGLGAGILLHSVHNTIPSLISGAAGILFGTLLDWSGWLVMFGFVIAMIAREQRMLKKELIEEVSLGTMTEKQYHTAYSGWARFTALVNAMGTAHFQNNRKFYQLCAELAHKKHQYGQLGEERGNSKIISTIRMKMSLLSGVLE
jgi:protease PrsW